MIILNKYVILNVDFSNKYDHEYNNLKYNTIATFIFNQVENYKCFLFEMKPTKNSIIYDITSLHQEIRINSKSCLYTDDINLSKKDIRNIVEDEGFYLGHLIIVLDKPNEKNIVDLVNLWNEGIYKTGLEFFKMDSDGLSFYWYNPTNNKAENNFKEMISNF